MAGSRTLKLSILADVDDLRNKLGAGDEAVGSFGDKLGDFGKKAGLAFAAAGAAAAAYAGKLLIDGVKAAVEDEKAQAALAATLKNVAGASGSVVANVEKYISKTAVAVGITDDQLRPSFDRLVRSTKDVAAAQELQTLALDIAAGSGKSLELVSNALAKAYEGNTSALGRLGIGLSAAELKSMSLDEITKTLADTFGGQATIQADTFQGKLTRLGIAFDEAKETVGSFILDAITPLLTAFVENVIPALDSAAESLGSKLGPTFASIAKIVKDDLLPILKSWWQFLSEVIVPAIIKTVVPIIAGLVSAFNRVKEAIQDNRAELQPLINGLRILIEFVAEKVAPVIGKTLGAAFKAAGAGIAAAIEGISRVSGAIQSVIDKIRTLIALVKANPLVKGISNVFDAAFGGGRAVGGSIAPSTAYVVGENGPELFMPNTSGRIIPNNAIGSSPTINLNVSGAIDPEGTARTIIKVLNDSFARGTLGSLAFRS
jgi:hypothetical protein